MKQRQGFSKQQRLKKSSEYRKVYNKGKSCKVKGHTIWIYPNNSNDNRLGISIPKKKFRLATSRNRIRRLIKEIHRINKECLKPGYDIIIAPAPGEKDLSYKNLEKEILKLYEKAGVLSAQDPDIHNKNIS